MGQPIRQIVMLTVLALLSFGGPALSQPQTTNGPIYSVPIQGTITSVTIDYLRRSIQVAEASDATLLLIQLSSSGGVLRDMRPFADEIAKAEVPIVIYVAPANTQSGAAGAFFGSAAHIFAMAPETSFGSPYSLTQVDAALSDQTRDLVLDSVANQLRTWNTHRGRGADWVDRAVREGVILTNQQAIELQPPAIDLVAADQQELLTLLEGRIVKLHNGRSVQLSTLGRSLTPIEATLWEQLRLWLADPTIAFVLLLLGAMAIYFELAASGTSIFAGIGVVLLIGAAMGLLVLPIRWWALLLVLLAFGFVGGEFFVTAHGALAVIGVGMLFAGALNLIDPLQAPGTVIALWAIIVIALMVVTIVVLGIWLALRSRDRPVTTGQEALIGRMAEVRRRLDPKGMVFVEGALWQAISENGTVEPGDWVRVVAVQDLHLIVRRLEDEA